VEFKPWNMVLSAGVSALEGTRKKVEAGRMTFRWLRLDATWTPYPFRMVDAH
jgi:hypothetical protein